ncbi:M48 family metalloprotease [Litorimonas sp. WD9-15]|uniref:M48 family metalloprotease n=1 Tax=Litorimonas sp. WD9-15 TaxID=3418716 RepID=UPI003D04D27B
MPAEIAPPSSLPYHQKLSTLLEENEVELWNWFSGDTFTSEAYEAQRLYLLKNSYRLEDESHAKLYKQARQVAARLGIELPVTLYQAMNSDLRNAGLIFQPDEVHILFSGDLFSTLSETELDFILGHEMAHHLHNTRQNSRYGTADRLLDWICGEPGSVAAHSHSFRLSRLYQEIFSDRVGLYASQNLEASICALVRVTSGLVDVSAKAYLKQADEALAASVKDGVQLGSESWSHPETFIRARALADWDTDPDTATEKLIALVEGSQTLEQLDLLGQKKLSELTQNLISVFLQYPWRDKETLVAHAQGFFVDIEGIIKKPTPPESEVIKAVKMLPKSMKEFFAYVLLDFATVDSDLEDRPLIEATHFADRLDMTDIFNAALKQDLKLSKNNISTLRKTDSFLEAAE